MDATNSLQNVVVRGWKYWRHNRRSYLLALFASTFVPFGIVYSGFCATTVIGVAWCVLIYQIGIHAIDLASDENAVIPLTSPVLVTALIVCAMHLVVPIVAVAIHNFLVKSRNG